MPDRLAQLLKMHEADPADAFCAYALALEHVKLGKREEALAWLEKALARDGDFAYAYYQKGKLLAAGGDAPAARAALTAGLAAAKRKNDAKGQSELAALLATLPT